MLVYQYCNNNKHVTIATWLVNNMDTKKEGNTQLFKGAVQGDRIWLPAPGQVVECIG